MLNEIAQIFKLGANKSISAPAPVPAPEKPTPLPTVKPHKDQAEDEDKHLLEECQKWQKELSGFVKDWYKKQNSTENFYGRGGADTTFHINNLNVKETEIYFRDYANTSNSLRMQLEGAVTNPSDTTTDYLEKPSLKTENGQLYLTALHVAAISDDFSGLVKAYRQKIKPQ